MISVADAQAHVLALVTRVAAPEVIPVVAGLGRVLAEDVRATLDVPPTANSAVDGYAVRSGDIPASGTRDLNVVADLAPGAVVEPRRALLSTGDEVTEPGPARKPGQIFDSNRFSLHGLVEAAGGEPTDHGIVPDLYDVLHARLRAAATTADVVLTSGGVSVGDHDLVKAVLQNPAGIASWQVAMHPGRPP